MILLAFKASELSQVSISPPAKRGSLDLDKGATLPSPSSLRLLLSELRMLWSVPGPDHHIPLPDPLGCLDSNTIRQIECQKNCQTECQKE